MGLIYKALIKIISLIYNALIKIMGYNLQGPN